MDEITWLEGYYSFLLTSGFGSDGEVCRKVRRRIVDLKINKAKRLNAV